MTDDDKKRRNSLLASLAFCDGSSATVRVLRDELENVHNIPATRDRVHSDLRVLADIGAVRLEGDRALLTPEGREHVDRLRALF